MEPKKEENPLDNLPLMKRFSNKENEIFGGFPDDVIKIQYNFPITGNFTEDIWLKEGKVWETPKTDEIDLKNRQLCESIERANKSGECLFCKKYLTYYQTKMVNPTTGNIACYFGNCPKTHIERSREGFFFYSDG